MMRRFLPFLATLASAANIIDQNASPPNLTLLFNNTLFYTWRPRAHVIAPSGNVGDPCMHYTDPSTGLFHVGYLHNGAAGATTYDLVTYVDVNTDPTFIRAGGINDPIAVFDGSVIPYGINGTPTLLYTSVSYLPIQWTIPYTKGSETQSLAITTTGGKNFTKLTEGPVIPGPPFPVTNVTGFRDPFVFQSPQLDRAAGSDNDTWYVVISGGIHGEGPSQFLFRQYDADFRDWEYLGQWWHEPANSTWGNGTWAGRWGFNFEVSNVFALDEGGYQPEGEIFTTHGAEWSEIPIIPQVSQFREMLWASGNISTSANGTVKFEPTMAGKIDWGVFAYAAAGKILTANSSASQKSGVDQDRFVQYVWLTGNNFGTSDFPTLQQGWSGALATVRELAVGKVENVVDNDLVNETASWRVSDHDTSSSTVTLETLKQTPAREVIAAFKANASRTFTEPGRVIGSSSPSGYGNSSPSDLAFQQSPMSKFFLLTTTLTFPTSARSSSDLQAGLRILSSKHEHTDIYYQFSNESLIIDRTNSSAASTNNPGILNNNEAGRLRLFDIAAGNGMSRIESLNLMIVVDNSIVEVYANERFVLSTWVWSWYDASTAISFLHSGSESVEFGNVTLWEGLVDAWPERMY
jgi:beta-fructofuranosidase